MTQDEIIEMARQAGARAWQNQNCYVEFLCNLEQLEAFAKLAAEKEREACAKVCDELIAHVITNGTPVEAFNYASNACAALIRARGQA